MDRNAFEIGREIGRTDVSRDVTDASH